MPLYSPITRLRHALRPIADAVVPPKRSETEGEAEYRRLYALGHLGLVFWGAVFSTLYIVQDVPLLIQVTTFGIEGLGLAMIPAYRRGMSMRTGAWISAVLMFVGHIGPGIYHGGTTGPGGAWMAVLPLLGIALGRWRVALTTFFVVSAFSVFLYALEVTGNLPPRMLPDEQYVLLGPINLIAVATFLLVFGRAADLALHRRAASLERSNAALTEQIAERQAAEAALAEAQRQLIVAARNAGRAEVATGALHNIGNALNGVTVSSAQVERLVRGQRIARVHDLARLLCDLEDPRYAQFASKLATELENRREQILTELSATLKGVDHAVRVVGLQQEVACYGGIEEPVDLAEAVHAAALLVDLGREVRLSVGHGPPPIVMDRHRLLQILANLLTNARDALRGERAPFIRVTFDGGYGEVCIRVTDNGHGIAGDMCDRIFQHGFTTKDASNGVGLHAAALAATEMGGSLKVTSDGVGHGATFTVVLPCPFPSLLPLNEPVAHA